MITGCHASSWLGFWTVEEMPRINKCHTNINFQDSCSVRECSPQEVHAEVLRAKGARRRQLIFKFLRKERETDVSN